MPVESRDDLGKEAFRPDGILPVNVWTVAALAEEVRRLTTRIESDAKRIAELEAERDDIRLHFDQAMKEFDVRNEEIASLQRALAEERERCARIADETFNTSGWNTFMRSAGNSIATAIRSGKPDGKE